MRKARVGRVFGANGLSIIRFVPILCGLFIGIAWPVNKHSGHTKHVFIPDALQGTLDTMISPCKAPQYRLLLYLHYCAVCSTAEQYNKKSRFFHETLNISYSLKVKLRNVTIARECYVWFLICVALLSGARGSDLYTDRRWPRV